MLYSNQKILSSNNVLFGVYFMVPLNGKQLVKGEHSGKLDRVGPVDDNPSPTSSTFFSFPKKDFLFVIIIYKINPAYRRHQLSRPMRIEKPIQV